MKKRNGVWANCAELCEPFRLSSSGEDRTPPTARRVKSFSMGGEEFDGDVDETLVQKADHDASLAGHGGVDGVAREQIAEQCILAVGRTAADLVARVEVTHDDRHAFGFEERLDLLAQKRTYVL